METQEMLYEGKAKQVYRTGDPAVYRIVYKDDATAFDGEKKGTIEGKAVWNNRISAVLFARLEAAGIPTHYLSCPAPNEMLVRAAAIIPVEVIVRNIVAGSMARRLGVPEGTVLSRPVVEYCYKSDELHDPLINEDHIAALGWASGEEMGILREQALRINGILGAFLETAGLLLVDFKLEFGRTPDGVILADEISPDTCRLWDARTAEKLDKDRFRRDLGKIGEAYAEVWRRVEEAGRQQ